MRFCLRAILFAALIMAIMPPSAGAQLLAKPTAELTRFQIEAISLRDVTFLFELSVKNPYPVALTFSGLSLDFSVEGVKVFSTSSRGGFSVAARGSKSNVFTVTLAYDAIIKVVKDYASKDWLNTVVDGKLVIPLPKTPGLPSDISFSYKLEKKIPAIKPSIAIIGFTVTPPSAAEISAAALKAGKKVDAEKARSALSDILSGRAPAAQAIDPAELDLPLKLSYTIEIKNDAKGPLAFNSLDYELFINGESLVLGKSTDVKRDGQRILVTVTNSFSSKRLSKNIRALFSSKKGDFRVKGSASLKLPDEIRKEAIGLSFDEKGSFSLK